jgi:nitrogen fixation NifU-like protein
LPILEAIFIKIAVATIVVAVIIAVWFGIHLMLHPWIRNPDGIARITGTCGDTMEIALKFDNGRIERTHQWTNGCTISKICVESAAALARGKTAAQIQEITIAAIMEKTGTLPETHLHCAQLALTTLHAAAAKYELNCEDHLKNRLSSAV